MSGFTKRIVPAVATSLLATGLVSTVGTGQAAADTTLGNNVAAIANANLGKTYCSANSTGAGGSPNAAYGFGTSCSGEEWCADFAKWAWNQGGYSDTSDINASAYSFAQHGAAKGTFHWITDTSYTPQPGDAIVWMGNGYNLTSTTDPSKLGYYDVQHVDLVYSVSSRTSIHTIGGNESSQVKANSFDPTDSTLISGRTGQQWGQSVIGYISPGAATSSVPAGFNVQLWGFNSGQILSGTVNLTAHASQQGVINYLDYRVTGPNGYDSGLRAPSAGGAANYPLALDTIPLAPGTYTVSMIANEIDGADHTYVGGSFTVPGAQASNVLRTLNGALALYNVGTDGNVYGISQSSVGGAWSAWGKIAPPAGVTFAGKVSAIMSPNGAITLYVRSTNGWLYGISQFSAYGSWGAWGTVGGSSGVASDPAVLLTQQGTVAIYVANGAGDVSGVSQAVAGGTFGTWSSLAAPGGMTGQPAVIQDSSGRISVYARNTNGWLYGTTQTTAGGAFGSWGTVGGSTGVASDPAVLLTQQGTVAIYVANGAGDVSGVSQAVAGGTFGTWSSLAAPSGMTGKPSVIQDAAGRISVYARNANGSLYGTTQVSAGGAFSAWSNVGGTASLAVDPTALIATNEFVAVYSKDGVGDVLGVSQTSVGGAFANWQMM